MKTKTVVSLLLALVMGVAAFLVGRDLIERNKKTTPDNNLNLVTVIAAQRDIEAGQKLDTAADLKKLDVPKEVAIGSYFTKVSDLENRVASVAIAKGQIIADSMLATNGLGEGLQSQIEPGKRAVTLEVTESTGMSGLLVPGCVVDVVSTLRKDNHQVARTIVQKAVVKAIGPRLNPAKGSGSEVSEPVRAITLMTDPKSVEKIDLAVSLGHARLTLRRTDDDVDIKDKPITLAELAGLPEDTVAPKPPVLGLMQAAIATTNPATAQPAPQPVWTTEIIRRTVPSTVSHPVTLPKIETPPN